MTAVPCPICGGKPSCPLQARWDDDDSVHYLFSEGCSHDEVDKKDFWQSAIAHRCGARASLCFTKRSLTQSLQRRGTTPLLGSVLEILVREGVLLLVGDIQAAAEDKTKSSKSGTAKRLFKAAVVWPTVFAWRLIVGSDVVEAGEDDVEQDAPLAYRSVVERVGAVLVDYCKANVRPHECTFLLSQHHGIEKRQEQERGTGPSTGTAVVNQSLQAMAKRAADSCGVESPETSCILRSLSPTDVDLLVAYMVLEGLAVRDGNIVKIVVGESAEETLLTSADKDVLFLRCTADQTRAMCRKLEQQSGAAREDAMRAKRSNQTGVALAHLRRHKMYSRALEQRLGGLHSIEAVLGQLESLELSKAILGAQEKSVNLLKSFREKHDLNIERVDDAINALSEEMEISEGVSNAIAGMGAAVAGQSSGVGGDDDAALEAELAALMRQESDACNSEDGVQEDTAVPLAVVPTVSDAQEMESLSARLEATAVQDDGADSVVGAPTAARVAIAATW